MLKKVLLEEFFESEKTLNASMKALQYLYDVALKEGQMEILETLDSAISTCDEIKLTCEKCPIKESKALLEFYFIRTILVLNPDEMKPLLSFLEWMSVLKKYH